MHKNYQKLQKKFCKFRDIILHTYKHGLDDRLNTFNCLLIILLIKDEIA